MKMAVGELEVTVPVALVPFPSPSPLVPPFGVTADRPGCRAVLPARVPAATLDTPRRAGDVDRVRAMLCGMAITVIITMRCVKYHSASTRMTHHDSS